MKKLTLVFIVVLLTAGIAAGVWLAANPADAGTALRYQTTVKSMCSFPVVVEVRDDALGTVETANCPAFGSDIIGDLAPGWHTVMVWKTESGAMFAQRRVMVEEMHHTVLIHPNGNVTLQQ